MASYKVATDRLDGHKVGDVISDKDVSARQIAKLLASGAIVKHTESKKKDEVQEEN